MIQEKTTTTTSGWTALAINIASLVITGVLLFVFIQWMIGLERLQQAPNIPLVVVSLTGIVLLFIVTLVSWAGFFTLEPNEARVLVLFGSYVGTVRDPGFHWTNPFYNKRRISLRTRNMESQRLKVNDKRGNPIEIAAVVVWRVRETAQAVFDVEDYEAFVKTQAESAVRHLASTYSYDHAEAESEEITLLSGQTAVNHSLVEELQERLARAGVQVEEARITHLAYAPEIAGTMLRRQQAEAVIAARQKIVHGAVSMVQMALKELETKEVIVLDDERKAAMVSNLLIVLCSDHDATPVINTGTLHTG